MKIKDIFGRQISKNLSKYEIDWDRKVSAPQKRVKDIVYPDWYGDRVFEELLIPSSRLRVDLVNFSKMLVIEISPKQHREYNEFFHKNRSNFLAAQKRDFDKIKWVEENGFTYIEIDQDDLKLSDEEILKKIDNNW